jgi:DNA-directed RNA polymerase subunit M/transcription elongation factor TFIIS
MIKRKEIIETLNKTFNNDLSEKIENYVYDKYNDNLNFYYNKIFNIINNKTLVEKLKKSNKINRLDDINYYYNWSKIKIESDLINNQILVNNNTGSFGIFYCSKCKKKTKCVYNTAQTRSADEGLTSFITCCICSYTWKEN